MYYDVNLLLDTCKFVWLAAEPQKLSETASAAIDEGKKNILLSDVSIWEICVKWRSGKLRLPSPPRIWIEEQRTQWRLGLLSIESKHLYGTTELEMIHQDPYDRMLVAQSIAEGMRVVSPDRNIAQYPLAVVW